MAIPETYDLVLPLLEIIKDKDEYKVQEITEEVIDYIDISDEDKEIRLPNNEPVINSRISTANTYLKKAELIESEEDLMEYDGFREYKNVFIHDDTKDLDINELNPTDALRESFKKQMESVQKEIEEDMKEENKKTQNKKYFQSNEYDDSNKVFGIKANRENIKDKKEDKYSKCHDKKHKHHHKHKKLVLNIEFSPAEELLKYAELFEKGYLTKEEFEKKKEELLNIEYKI